jgi:hypothetical protein
MILGGRSIRLLPTLHLITPLATQSKRRMFGDVDGRLSKSKHGH